MPEAHRAHAEWTPERMKRWAAKIGQKTQQFIDHMIASRSFPEQAYRFCLGVLRLGNRYGAERLEKACEIALGVRVTRYQQVELILKNKVDVLSPETSPATTTAIHHDNIRGAQYYH